MKNIRDFNLEELENELINLGEKKFRAKQIFAWIYRGVTSFDVMTELSKDLIEKLKQNYIIDCIFLENFQKSKDGTIKYLQDLYINLLQLGKLTSDGQSTYEGFDINGLIDSTIKEIVNTIVTNGNSARETGENQYKTFYDKWWKKK